MWQPATGASSRRWLRANSPCAAASSTSFRWGAEAPLRLDLFDDEIDAIRSFDPDSQRSTGNVDRVRILPGHEFAFDEESRNRFRAAWRAAFPGDPNKCPVYVDVGSGICSPGIEYCLPLFFESTGTLADYLPDNALFITLGETRDAIDAFMRQTQERYKFLSHDAQRPALAPEKLFDKADDFFDAIAPFGRISLKAPKQASIHRLRSSDRLRIRPPS